MKMQNTVFSEKETSTTGETKKMRLSQGHEKYIFDIFTKNIYSNPIGTVIREITSNCYDSHIEAGVNTPVKLKLIKENDEYILSFIDNGVGMSPERVENIYGVYFESTKRNNDNEIGGFGVGAKSVLAYKRFYGSGVNEYDNTFYVDTIFNGIKYHYVIFEGKESPEFDLLFTEETTEKNGTEVKVPIKLSDINRVVDEIRKQLCYFENIVFEGFEIATQKNLNDYKIYKGKSFMLRSNTPYTRMHIIIGSVAYPIDFSIIGLNSYAYSNLPVGIIANIGDVSVNISRETIDYSQNSIEFIRNGIKETEKELIEMLTLQNKSIVDLFQYYELENNLTKLKIGDNSLNLRNIINDDTALELVNFKYNGYYIPSFNDLISTIIEEIRTYGDYRTREKRYFSKTISPNTFTNNNSTLYTTSGIERKANKNKYLLENNYNKFSIIRIYDLRLFSDDPHTYSLIQKSLHSKLRGNSWFDINVRKHGADKSIDVHMNMIYDILDFIYKNSKDYNTFEVPEEYLTYLKSLRKRNKLEELEKTITLNYYSSSYNWGNSTSRLNMTVKDLSKHSGRIVYGNTDDASFIVDITKVYDKIHDIKSNDSNGRRFNNCTIICFVSKSNERYLKQLPNAIHINEYVKILKKRKGKLLLNLVVNEKINTKIQFDLPRVMTNDIWKQVDATMYNNVKKLSNDIALTKNSKYTLLFENLVTSSDVVKEMNKQHYVKMIQNAEVVREYINKHENEFEFIYTGSQYYDMPGYVEFLKKVFV